MKIRPVGAELFHADGRTDMAKPIVAFRYFANEPKNVLCERITCVCLIVRFQTMNKLRHGGLAVDEN